MVIRRNFLLLVILETNGYKKTGQSNIEKQDQQTLKGKKHVQCTNEIAEMQFVWLEYIKAKKIHKCIWTAEAICKSSRAGDVHGWKFDAQMALVIFMRRYSAVYTSAQKRPWVDILNKILVLNKKFSNFMLTTKLSSDLFRNPSPTR